MGVRMCMNTSIPECIVRDLLLGSYLEERLLLPLVVVYSLAALAVYCC